jgi:hypothetical protein
MVAQNMLKHFTASTTDDESPIELMLSMSFDCYCCCWFRFCCDDLIDECIKALVCLL